MGGPLGEGVGGCLTGEWGGHRLEPAHKLNSKNPKRIALLRGERKEALRKYRLKAQIGNRQTTAVRRYTTAVDAKFLMVVPLC